MQCHKQQYIISTALSLAPAVTAVASLICNVQGLLNTCLLSNAISYHSLQRVHIGAERPQSHLLNLAPFDQVGVRITPRRWQLVLIIGVRQDSECACVSVPP